MKLILSYFWMLQMRCSVWGQSSNNEGENQGNYTESLEMPSRIFTKQSD